MTPPEVAENDAREPLVRFDGDEGTKSAISNSCKEEASP
eukprot:CAMPEP_0205961516 /NCGR_PEP_ID=MMETSP1459-20131121/67464_1 /ASSEMBLY_ACC=CAM_ASM_001120 /TAXON_ID=41880 /ORGANISM="Pycnococcus provasolii, Strain RCC931" /LENGTH=38 /DNA_ID= /DNA_START= /DNA_END= /DNA_ORIENTATION=